MARAVVRTGAGAGASADADGGKNDHGQHDHKILNDQEAERYLAVEGVDLALVRQQLHDDDGAGECQRHRDIQAGDGVQSERQPDAESKDGGEGDLTEAGHDGDRTQRANKFDVELDADQKQQHRDAKFRQEADLCIGADNVEHRRSGDQTNGNEADDQRLSQDDADKTDRSRHDQQGRDLTEGGLGDNFDQSIFPLPMPVHSGFPGAAGVARPTASVTVLPSLCGRFACSRMKSSRSSGSMRQPRPMSIARSSPSLIQRRTVASPTLSKSATSLTV